MHQPIKLDALVVAPPTEVTTKHAIELWRLPLTAQKDIIKEMSFVRPILGGPTQTCRGWKVADNHVCKNPPRYTYKHTKGRGEKAYCWAHLLTEGIYGPYGERERVENWLKRNNYIQ